MLHRDKQVVLYQRSSIQNAGFKKRGLSERQGSVRLSLAVP
jgi:hypothetical protein